MLKNLIVLFRFSLLFLWLAACNEPGPIATETVSPPTRTVLPAAISTPVETPEKPTVETPPTPTLLAPTPTSPVQPSLPTDAVPCGVILPILPNISVPLTAELPQVEIPETVPEAARPALERLLAAPETVGLAAYEIGAESAGVYLNPDLPMPLASVIKILNLIAYAEEANAGNLDPGQWIPLSEMDRYYLPGTDLGSHRLALQDLKDRNLIAFDPQATPLEEIPWMMMRFSSNAAADYLHKVIGQEKIEQTAVTLGLTAQTAPCPFIGQFLAMSNHERTGSDKQAIEDYIADPASYGEEVIRLTEQFASDDAFRQDEIEQRGRIPYAVTSYFAENLNAEGSAREYAHLMARIFDNGLSSSYVNILVRRNLEWPTIFEANQELFTSVGYKNGAFPGILTTVYYAQRLEDGRRVVVALFYRNLPETLYRDWRQNLPHDEFARWLLADPQAIPKLKSLINQ